MDFEQHRLEKYILHQEAMVASQQNMLHMLRESLNELDLEAQKAFYDDPDFGPNMQKWADLTSEEKDKWRKLYS